MNAFTRRRLVRTKRKYQRQGHVKPSGLGQADGGSFDILGDIGQIGFGIFDRIQAGKLGKEKFKTQRHVATVGSQTQIAIAEQERLRAAQTQSLLLAGGAVAGGLLMLYLIFK